MSNPNNITADALLELLADEATFGLGIEEQQLLDALPADISDKDREELMRVAGLTQMSFLKLDRSSCQDMPANLRNKVEAQAKAFFEQNPNNES